METVKKRYNKIELGMYVCIILFFGYLGIFGKIGIYNDTASYLNLTSERDPLYAVFLWIFSFLPSTVYLRVIVLLQNILLIVSCIYLLHQLTLLFRLSGLMQVLVTGCMLIPHILIPFATVSGMILGNSILSEGITFSLYTLFFTALLSTIFSAGKKKKYQYGVLSLVYAFLLSTARSQLMSVLIVWMLVMVMVSIYNKRAKNIILVVLFLGIAFGSKSIVNGVYNWCANDVYTQNTSQEATKLSNSLFSVDLSKDISFESEELQAVYDEIREKLVTEQLNYAYAPDQFEEFVSYYEYCHDEVKFNQMVLPIHMYVRNGGHITPMDTSIYCDRVAGEINKEIQFTNLSAYVHTYCMIALSGFIRSVAAMHPILNWVAFAVYLTAFGIILVLFRMRKKYTDVIPALFVMLLVLLMIAGIVSSTALITICISRYVIYNMSLFYIALLLGIQAWIRKY